MGIQWIYTAEGLPRCRVVSGIAHRLLAASYLRRRDKVASDSKLVISFPTNTTQYQLQASQDCTLFGRKYGLNKQTKSKTNDHFVIYKVKKRGIVLPNTRKKTNLFVTGGTLEHLMIVKDIPCTSLKAVMNLLQERDYSAETPHFIPTPIILLKSSTCIFINSIPYLRYDALCLGKYFYFFATSFYLQ